MEGIKKAMDERNPNEGQWEDGKQWSLGVGQRRNSFEIDIYIFTLPHISTWHGACTYGKMYYGANSASSVHNRSDSHAVACRMFGLFLVPSAFPVQMQC
jgi:hypothetical protein